MTDSRATADHPVEDLTYEQARDELVAVVARLEAGGETLEGSLALWERGEALAARCQQWLDGARTRLEAARGGAGPAAHDGPGSASDGPGASPDDAPADAAPAGHDRAASPRGSRDEDAS